MPRKSQAQKWLELGKAFKKQEPNPADLNDYGKEIITPKLKTRKQNKILSGFQEALDHAKGKEISVKVTTFRKPPKNTNLYPVYLPQELIISAKQKLSERNIELETFLQIYLRMILRASKGILGLQDEFGFGKYRGEKVEEIIKIDPTYVAWLITQDGRTKFEPEVLVLVNEMITK